MNLLQRLLRLLFGGRSGVEEAPGVVYTSPAPQAPVPDPAASATVIASASAPLPEASARSLLCSRAGHP